MFLKLRRKIKRDSKAREMVAHPSQGILNSVMLRHDISIQNLYINEIKNIL